MLAKSEGVSGHQKLFFALQELSDHYTRSLYIFYPLLKQASTDTKKSETRTAVFSEYKSVFCEHVKHCILDAIDYSTLFDLLLDQQFDLWKLKVDESTE